MSGFENVADNLFGRYSEASFDDPEQIALLVSDIELQFASEIELKAEAYNRGLCSYSFGPKVDDESPTRHPLLAIAMFRGILGSIEGVEEADRPFIRNYGLIQAIQVCTEGAPDNRDYSAALGLVRELFPLKERKPTDGMNDYEDFFIAYSCLSEDHTAVLPQAVEVFTDLIRYELAAIRAGKSILKKSEIHDERIVAGDDADVVLEELHQAGATVSITTDNNDGTFTQMFGTGEYEYCVPILDYACQARAAADLDILDPVISHAEFVALPESAQASILKGYASDAEEAGQNHLIDELLAKCAVHLPHLSSVLRWEIDL